MPETTSSPVPSPAPESRVVAEPRLLIAWEPWYRSFWESLTERLRAHPPLELTARPHRYWPDALVTPQMKPKHFVLSVSWHVFAVLFIYMLPMLLVVIPRPAQIEVARREMPLYAPLSEYLPPVNSGAAPAKVARKGEPKLAKQEIVSLPKNPDNFEQTIISPPEPAILKKHVALPNMVVWNPEIGPAPVAATRRDISQMKIPRLDQQVVEPAPSDLGKARLQLPALPQAAVVMPAGQDVRRPIGEMNVAQLDATVAEPVLTLPTQRAVPGMGAPAGPAPAAPPASAVTGGAQDIKGVGRLIALGLNPTMPQGPVQSPGGSRYGEFAAGPKGKPDAPGTPDIAGGGNGAGGHGSGEAGPGSGTGNGLPGGVYVGTPPPGATVGPIAGNGAGSPAIDGPGLGEQRKPTAGRNTKDLRTLASLERPKVGDIPRQEPATPATAESRLEDQVFGGKTYYQMAVNMPNLTSAGGSWIIRFAELKPKPGANGNLAAPTVLVKVDPAYSGEALRQRVEGKVVLYAVIRADGTVAEVRVLQSLDDKLDHNAAVALQRWKFRPASRNGIAEDVEAVVTIPFRVSKLF